MLFLFDIFFKLEKEFSEEGYYLLDDQFNEEVFDVIGWCFVIV